MDHFDGHLALGIDLGKLFLDVLQDALGDLGGGHIRYQSNREFACEETRRACQRDATWRRIND